MLISLFIILLSSDIALDFENIPFRLANAVIMFIIFFSIHKIGNGLGFGDVKFITILAYTMSFQNSVRALLLSSLLALLFISIKKILFGSKTRRLPFAPFLSIGSIFMLFLQGGA